MKRVNWFVYGLVAFALLLTACQVQPMQVAAPQEAPAAAEAAPTPTPPDLDLILIQHALCAWDAFWCVVERGIDDAAKAMNVNVTVLGPDEFDLAKVAALIDQAVAAQPDGIGLTVSDPVLFKEPLMRAIEAGIPVIAYNAGAGPTADGIPYLTFIGQDEYAGGYQGGKRLAAQGGTRGVCINHQVGHVGLDARCRGFVDALAENGIEAEVLGITNDPAESQTIISDYYTANPDVDIFLTLGPNGANPFYAFLEAAGLGPDDVLHGTFDLSPEIVARIKDGTTLFGIDQQPYLQGYMVVQWLTWVNRYGLTPPSEITLTGPGFVDKSNVEKVEALAGTYR